MKLTDIFWRWLSCLLTVSFVLSLLQLHLYTGYPKVWDTVQVGMTISQVREICGPPTNNNSGMKPDNWLIPFAFGNWHLKIGHGEIGQGPQSVVYSKEILFVFNGFQKAWIRLHQSRPPVQDWNAYYRAFGQEFKPER